MKSLPTKPDQNLETVLSKESLDALEELAMVLKPIYLQMKKQGYRIVDGKMIHLSKHELETTTKDRHPKDY